MHCNYVMMSLNDISLIEEERVDVDGAERDGVEWEGEAVESDFRDLNCASLRLTIA